MATLTDEYSGKNDPYKKPPTYQSSPLIDFQMQRIADGRLMTGREWYDRTMSEVATVFRNRPDNDYDLGLAIRQALRRAANLTDKETTDE